MSAYHFLVLPRQKRARVNRRLKEGHKQYLQSIQILKEQSEKPGDWGVRIFTAILGKKRLARLRSLMLQADILQTPATFLKRTLCLAGLGLAAGIWLLQSPLMGVLVAAGLSLLPFLYLKARKRNKTKKFELQMPDGMELLARSLRAGHTLPSAIELAGEQLDAPMGTEMKIAYEEQQFGLSTSEVLLHMLERVDSMDLRYFVAAVLIQQETGGNLAELMENIAHVIRSRLNFKSKVRALTAMGRISTTIMIIAPVVAFFGLMTVASTYEKALYETAAGRTMLVVGVLLVFTGAYFLKRMIDAVES